MIALGIIVILLSAIINAALEYPNHWRRFWGFLLTIVILLAMAAGGALMGLIIRSALSVMG